ncbi:MAG: MMPL family transporter, partial [Pirellulaceae bacterium]|nr:MMPL family transporter [Pirellulaceae bacterium]
MRGRNLALLVAAALFLVSLPAARKFSLDWQLDRMFPAGDPLVASYHRLEQRFGGNEIVLAVYHDDGLWSKDGSGLDRLSKVSDRLAATAGVRGVLSLAELHRILEALQALQDPMGLLKPQGNQPLLLDPDNKLAQAFAKVFEGYTHISGQDTVAIACMLEPLSGDRVNHRDTIVALRAVMSDLPEHGHDGFITGEPVMVTDGFDMVERDGWRLGAVSTCLLALVLLVVFRSLRWALIPLAVVHWAIVVTQGILAGADLELTMVSSMLTAIITVVGVATTMHLLLGYQQQRAAGLDGEAAMQATMRALRTPVIWACVTDAVGFVSLSAAQVGPVRDFGVMMAIGSLVVLLAIMLLVPGLALLGPWDRDPRVPPFDFYLRVLLRKLLFEVLERRTACLIGLVLLAIFGVWGSLRMHVETDFTKNFRQSSTLVQGYRAVESQLGGAGVWDIMLPAPRVITEDYLASVIELEERLRKLRTSDQATGLQLTKVLSIADAEAASRAGPLLARLPLTARLEGMRHAMPVFTQALLTAVPTISGATADSGASTASTVSVGSAGSVALVDESTRWLRIMLRSREQASAQEKSRLVDMVTENVAEFTRSDSWTKHFDSAPPAAEVTGYYVMLGRLVSSVLSDQWKCFLLATLGILIVMTIATGSLWLALAALIPNALPVFLVLGAMGWIGMSVNMGAAMIAAVSRGLSIDSSMHSVLHMR